MALIDKPHYRNAYRSALTGGVFLGSPVPTRADAEQVATPTGIRPIFRIRVIPFTPEERARRHRSRIDTAFAELEVARQNLIAQRARGRADRILLSFGVGCIVFLLLCLGYIGFGIFFG